MTDCNTDVKDFKIIFSEELTARFKFFLGLATSALGLFLNLVVLVFKLKKNNNKNNLQSYSSQSISACFIICALFSIPVNTINSIYNDEPTSLIDSLLCTIWHVVDYSLFNTITLFMIVLSYNQYKSLKKPFVEWKRNKKRKTKHYFIDKRSIMFYIWLGPLFAWTITALIYRTYYFDNCDQKKCFFISATYIAAVGLFTFLLPLAILITITILFTLGIRKKIRKSVSNLYLKKTGKVMNLQNRVSIIDTVVMAAYNNETLRTQQLKEETRNSYNKQLIRKDKKLVGYMLSNELIFFICLVPYVFMTIPDSFYLHWLAYLTSVLYPIIYLIFK
jgi:hypothetical protein